MRDDFIAHVLKMENGDWARPHKLLDHLLGTAKRAEIFAKSFNSAEWGFILGLAHDLGKGRPLWQKYLYTKSGYDDEAHLEGKRGKLPHAIHGAELVEKIFGKGIGRILAYCMAGHHSGLPDWSSAEGAGRSTLNTKRHRLEI